MIVLLKRFKRSISGIAPLPFVIRSRMSSIRWRPIRHGAHCPQDSLEVNSIKNLAIFTMQLSLSITIIPPEPMIAPNSLSDSYSIGVSRYSSGMHPPDGPPVCTALNFFPFGTPPPMSKINSRNVIPIGISTRPVFLTFPDRANTFVPGLPSVPIERNHSAPLRIMWRMFPHVSTLLIRVGIPNRPRTAGYGGRRRAIPRSPSIEAMRAVSSPQTNAPAPILTSISNKKPVSKMFSPRRPASRAAESAICSRLIASGYSARM